MASLLPSVSLPLAPLSALMRNLQSSSISPMQTRVVHLQTSTAEEGTRQRYCFHEADQALPFMPLVHVMRVQYYSLHKVLAKEPWHFIF